MGIDLTTIIVVPILIYCFPIILTALSSKASGSEKVGWVILVFIMSWLGYAAFLIIKSMSAKQNETT